DGAAGSRRARSRPSWLVGCSAGNVEAKSRINTLEHPAEGASGPRGDGGGARALLFEVVREGHRGEEHGLGGHRTAGRDDGSELLVDDGGEALELFVAGAGHDAVRLTSNAELHRPTRHCAHATTNC